MSGLMLPQPAGTEAEAGGMLPRLGAGNPALQGLIQKALDGERQLALLHVDIEHFASINQNMGVDVGDAALQIVGQRLRAGLAGRGEAWRHGSDEFIVALVLEPGGPTAENIAEALIALINQPLSILPYTLLLTARAGVAVCPLHGSDASALLQYAESMLWRGPRPGASAARQAEDPGDAGSAIQSERAVSRLIVDALERDEFQLRYQPKVSARDGRVLGMEALIRWHSPILGELLPERFIRTAERLGVILQIGDWMVERAVAQARAWREQGFDDFYISVNISTLQLLQPGFVEHLLGQMQQAGLPNSAIVLEINESVLNTHVHIVFQTIRMLRREGISLTLDNFGTGDANLRTLVRYPADTLKIDRSFTSAALADSRETAILRAMIAMAQQLGMKVIANGVETEAQLAFLRRTDCDYFQGYLFGEPRDAAGAGQVLRERYLRPELFTSTRSDQTLLLVDDEDNVLNSLVRLFRRDGYRILAVNSVKEALSLLATNEIQVILSDQRMSEMSGTEFLAQVKMLYPDTIRIVLSGYADLTTVTEAINHGAIYRFLTKPWDDHELREHIQQAFRTYEAQRKRK